MSAPARELTRALDPVALARGMGLDPDPWQGDALRSEAQEALWLCSRQSGKTTTAVVLALATVVYGRPGSTVVVVSPSQRQSTEMMTRLRAGFDALGRPVPTTGDRATELALVTGSRAIALPASEATGRGLSPDLLLLDEAARIPGAVYLAHRPSLAASGGRLVALSTPFGRRGWFAEGWHDETADWHRVKVTAEDCPRISSRWLERERAALGDAAFAREYLCEFADADTALFSHALLQRAIRDDIEPLRLGESDAA